MGCAGRRSGWLWIVLVAAAVWQVVTPPAGAQDFAVGRAVFDTPQVNGVALDWCVTWGTDCGEVAAHRFCQLQGYGRSIGYLTYTPGRTAVPGDGRICEGNSCGGFLRVECDGPIAAGLGPATAEWADAELAVLLLGTSFEWVANGSPIGTIRFRSDGSARASWSDVPHTWSLDGSDLVVSADGTRWVSRLTFDPASSSFSGPRDVTSLSQDGMQTVLRPAPATP
jgi:hypothetical protein